MAEGINLNTYYLDTAIVLPGEDKLQIVSYSICAPTAKEAYEKFLAEGDSEFAEVFRGEPVDATVIGIQQVNP